MAVCELRAWQEGRERSGAAAAGGGGRRARRGAAPACEKIRAHLAVGDGLVEVLGREDVRARRRRGRKCERRKREDRGGLHRGLVAIRWRRVCGDQGVES